MAFEPQYPVTRNPQIRDLEIVLFRTTDVEHPEAPQSVKFRVTVDDQWGHPMNHLHGNLLPHAPQQVKDALQGIMDWAWNKAQDEVIP